MVRHQLLVENDRCQGLAVIEQRSGQVRLFAGKSVIICTGGAGRIFPFTTTFNQPSVPSLQEKKEIWKIDLGGGESAGQAAGLRVDVCFQ